jgi:hypothetical protein
METLTQTPIQKTIPVKESKLINVHGFAMTSIQEMQFSKHVTNSGIAMNTLTPTQRATVVLDWLDLIHRG